MHGLYIDVSCCMPRKKFLPTAEFPYHVTARCTNQEWFGAPMEYVWTVFSDYLHFIWRVYDVRIHAFVLMGNHFHMLISTPEGNLDLAMNYLMREVSKRIGERSDRINQIFGGPYHWTLIRDSHYLHHAYKYIYRNPVRAGICARVEDYPYSTLQGVLGLDYLYIPTYDDFALMSSPDSHLQWLNKEYNEETREAIQKALRRKEFALPRQKKSQRPLLIENLFP